MRDRPEVSTAGGPVSQASEIAGAAAGRITAVETRDVQGNLNLLQLQDQRETRRLDGKLFDLVVPPGTLVVDASGRQLSTAEIEALRGKLAGR